MTTSNIGINSSHWTIVSDQEQCLLSGEHDMFFCYATSLPSASLKGHVLRHGDTLSNTSTTKKLYARAAVFENVAVVSTI